MTKKYTFPKNERLKSDIRLKEVYSTGTQLFFYPFKVYYLSNEEKVSRICISAPKRAFKSAIDRNTIKRRSKEAYRLNKDLVSNLNLDIYLIYIGKKVEDYHTIEKGMIKTLSGIKI
jgi:ribonuclease P protein component